MLGVKAVTAPVLRHAGSSINLDMKPGHTYGNQMFTDRGASRHCMAGDHWVSISAGGWKKTGPLKLWTCPACVEKRGKK